MHYKGYYSNKSIADAMEKNTQPTQLPRGV